MGNSERKLTVWAAVTGLVVGILALAWYWAPGGNGSGSGSGGAASMGLRQAPEIALKDAKGVVHTLADAKGASLMLIHFWAHWCPPCLEEIPRFAAFAKHPQAANYRLMAVSEDPTWEEAHKSLPSEGHAPNFVSVLDQDSKVSEIYGTYQYPETYAVRVREGRAEILMKWVGPQNWESPEFLATLERLAANQK